MDEKQTRRWLDSASAIGPGYYMIDAAMVAGLLAEIERLRTDEAHWKAALKSAEATIEDCHVRQGQLQREIDALLAEHDRQANQETSNG